MNIVLEKSDFNIFRVGYAEQVKHGFKPRVDTKPIRLSPPLDWNMNPLKDRNWCFQLHGWRMLQPIWGEFYGRDWARLKDEVLPWIRDWYAYHVVQGRLSTFMWYDMAVGLRSQHLALLLHLDQRGDVVLSDEEREEVIELSLLHVAKLRERSFISRNNHGIFQLVGLRLLGIVLSDFPELKGEEPYTSRQMRALIESQFSAEGVHVENSPDYHNFAVTHFGRIRPALFPSIADLFERKLKDARAVGPWFTMPDGAISAVGDSSGAGVPFVDAAPPNVQSTTRFGDRVLMKDLSRGGYAVVRTSPEVPADRSEMLLVKGQAISYIHAHADHLGFEFFVQGRPLFVDAGKYSYNSGEWREYFTSDRAHNVVGLGGKTFGPADTVLAQSGLRSVIWTGSHYVIEGVVARGQDFTHWRTFRYVPGERLVINDCIDAPVGDVPVMYLHLAEHADAELGAAGLIDITVNGRQVAVIEYPAHEFSVSLVRGRDAPEIQGWVSRSYGNKAPATVIELTGGRRTRSWEATVTLVDGGPRTDLLERPLPGNVVIPFLYSCRADRLLPDSGAGSVRRILLEYYGGEPDVIEGLLSTEFAAAGFTRTSSRSEQGGIRSYFRCESGVRINMLVRPAETYRVRTAGAVGTVYMAVISEQ